MLKFLIVFSLAMTNIWSLNFPKFNRGRMIGGNSAARRQFLYTVRLLSKGEYVCTGALIDRNWILTAAHCVADIDCVTIFLGVTDIKSSKELSEVTEGEEIVIHPDWDTTTNANDIALIKIRTIPISESILPVPLPTFSLPNFATMEHAYLSSWGSVGHFVLPARLQWSLLFIISNEACAETYDGIGEDKLCANMPPGVHASLGDSGSPLVLKGTPALVGITSVGSGNLNEPIVFARVSHFLQWIITTTNII